MTTDHDPLFLRMALREAKSEREKQVIRSVASKAIDYGRRQERQRTAGLFGDLGLVVADTDKPKLEDW